MTLLIELTRFTPMANMIAPSRTTTPVLKRMGFQDGVVFATDLDHYVTMPVSTTDNYTVLIKSMVGIIKGKPQDLEITPDGEHRLRVAFGGITATIPGNAFIDEFPDIPSFDYVDIGEWPKDFVRMLAKQLPFVSTDNLKLSLNGVYLDIKNALAESAATTGHILRRIQRQPIDNHDPFQGTIPVKTIKFLAKFMGESILVSQSDDVLRFQMDGGVVLYSNQITDRFPNYEAIMPKDYKGYAVFDRDTALSVLRAIKQFCNNITGSLEIRVTGGNLTAELIAQNDDTGEKATASFPMLEQTGDLTIGFNISYLIKSLKSCGETIRWEYGSETECGLFSAWERSDEKVLVMPIRLNV